MKLTTFIQNSDKLSVPKLGALMPAGQTIAELQTGAIAMSGSPSPFLDGGEEAFNETQKVLDFVIKQSPPDTIHKLDTLTLLSPVPRPHSIRDCMVFEKHVTQATRMVLKHHAPLLSILNNLSEKLIKQPLIKIPKVWYKRPIYYKSNVFSVIGPEAQVRYPKYTNKLDYELEFGIFIGRKGVNIQKNKAHKYIAGYTIFNDFSARDIQFSEMRGRLGPAKAKDFDTGNSLGPYLVTPDEIPDPYNLTMIARINGEEWSRGISKDMHFKFEDIIAYISQDETLYPGEFIGSGTVGNGCGLELNRWLNPGDTIELEIEGLGILRNHIIKTEKGTVPFP